MQNAAFILALAEPVTLVYFMLMSLSALVGDNPIFMIASAIGGVLLWYVGYKKQVTGNQKLQEEVKKTAGEAREANALADKAEQLALQEELKTKMMELEFKDKLKLE